MKKCLLVLTLAALGIALIGDSLMAMEVKFSGAMRVRGELFNENPLENEFYDDAGELTKEELEELFELLNGHEVEAGKRVSTRNRSSSLWDTRMRLQMDLVASDNLKGVYQLEIGDIVWGDNGDDMVYLTPTGNTRDSTKEGGRLATDGINVESRYLYIDFSVPHTPLNTKAGLMPIQLGHGLVFDETAAALLVSVDLDPVTVGIFTMKAAEERLDDDNDVDYYGLYVDAKLKHVGSAGLFGVYGHTTGSGVDDIIYDSSPVTEEFTAYDARWIGLTVDLALDIYTISFETDYYKASFDSHRSGADDFDSEGWLAYLDIGADFDPVTVGIAGLYATGNDNNTINDNDSEAFTPILPTDPEDACVVNWDNMFILDLKRNVVSNLISAKFYSETTPLEKLTTGLSVQGYWLEEDAYGSGKGKGNYAGTEIDLNASYNIYDQLDYSIQAAYMFTDDDVFGLETPDKDYGNNDIWFLGHKLVYTF